MNTLSIIIPVYHLLDNKNKIYFDILIQSIAQNLQSTYTHKRFSEVVIINDCPEEDIEKFIYSVFTKYNIPRSIIRNNQTNKGQGCSRNIGASLASGNYLHFIDQDDYISQDFILYYSEPSKKKMHRLLFRIQSIQYEYGQIL